MKKLKFRKFVRTILLFLSTCSLIVMLWVFFDCFTDKNTSKKKIITYTIKDDIDYVVNLKENQFYTSEEANKNNSYITSLMDTIQIYFNYEFDGDTTFSTIYSYEVLFSLTSVYKGDVVWEYEENILSKIEETVDDVKTVKVNNNVNIDISNIYNKANEFYELTGYPVDLNIVVEIKNEVNVDDYEKKIDDSRTLILDIPITDKVISINNSSDKSDEKKIFTEYQVDNVFNICLFVISGVLSVCLMPLTVRSYVSLFNLTNLDDYDRKLKKLKRRYSFLINFVEKEPNFNNKKIIKVDNFNELIPICIERDLMVSVYEKHKGKECWFYVLGVKEVYIYVLTLDYKNIDMS